MNYLIVCDNFEYKIAELVEAYKNHIQVILHPNEVKRKFGIKQIIYKLHTTDIGQFVTQLESIDIDLVLLFELIEDTTHYLQISDLSKLYFGDTYSEIQMTALLIALARQTIDFDNRQDGNFKKSTEVERAEKQLIANRAAIEAAQFEAYYNSLQLVSSDKHKHELPLWLAELSEQMTLNLINRPDKNLVAVRVINQFCKETGQSTLELLHNVGKIPDLADFFVQVFMAEHFPQGINYTHSKYISAAFVHNQELDVFSIDDSNTTEIDDAFSVQINPDGYTIGIHIAAPALNPKLLDDVVSNLSTIYYPGTKITMLGNDSIASYSLNQGVNAAVVSIYFSLDNEYAIQSHVSKVETVTIKSNLRIETLEQLFNNENIAIDHGYPYENELKVLHNFANKLEENRGRPSINSLFVDYNFIPQPQKIIITPRIRGNPIDKVVSELMILANCTWGRMLTNAFIPAIYRVKQTNYPVRMTLTPDSHVGLNVDYYTWATSPLRRSADFINQHQLICLLTGSKNHYSATNPELLEVVENFDTKYANYIAFQEKMERYWSLKYLLQENINELSGTFLYKSRVVLEKVPLEIDTQGIIPPQKKASQIKVRIFNINLAKLSFEFKILDPL